MLSWGASTVGARRRRTIALIAAIGLGLAGCGGDDGGDDTASEATAETDFIAFQDCVEADGSVGVAPGPTSVDKVAAEAGEGALQLQWPNGDYANVAVETTSEDAAATVDEYGKGETFLTEIRSYGSVVVAYAAKPSSKEEGLITDCVEQASQSGSSGS